MKKLITISSLVLIYSINISAQAGNALNFDGTNDGIDLNTALFSTTDATQPYTIEAWIKAPTQGDNCIVCQYTFPGDNRFQFEIRTNKLNWWKGYATNHISIFSTATITDNQWHHVAATRDGFGNVKLFIDGVQDGSGVDNLPFVNYNTTIGERIPTNSGHFDGNIDEVRIWGIARTQASIQSTMNQELLGSEPGLIAYYNFNQGVAGGGNGGNTILTDGTSNGNNGTLNDFALNGITSNWISSNAPLPVKLVDFRREVIKDKVMLTWITASELNNSGFEVQKSKDGKEWQIIDFIEGQGTSLELNKYQYLDKNPFSGTNYYRLKQTDFDDNYTYSKVISININKENQIQVFPNPTNGKLNISSPHLKKAKIEVLNTMGEIVKTIQWEGEDIDISMLSAGLYYLAIYTDKGVVRKTVVKE